MHGLSRLRGLYYGYYEQNFQSLAKIVCELRDPILLLKMFYSPARQGQGVYPVPFMGSKPRITSCSIPHRRGDLPASIVFAIETSEGVYEWNCIDAGMIVCMPLAGVVEPPRGEQGEQQEELERLTDEREIMREELRELLGPDASDEEIERILERVEWSPPRREREEGG